MADNNEQNELNGSADQGSSPIAPRRGSRQWEVNLRSLWPSWGAGDPVAAMRRFAEEVDRRVEDAGFGPGWLNRRFGGDPGSLFRWEQGNWSPQVEILQRQDQFIVRVDLPGVKKEDVRLHCTEDALTIEGERRQETEENREGFYRSERSYGSFSRTIPLPAGAQPDSATATFNDGVLEIAIPAPGANREKGQEIPIQ